MSSKIERWSVTPGENVESPPDGAPEGMNRSDVNDTIRENMASVRTFVEGADWFDPNIKPDESVYVVSQVDGTHVTVAGVDASAYYPVNRKVRLRTTSSGNAYAFVVSAVYSSPDTTITLEDFDALGDSEAQSDTIGLDMYLLGTSAEGGIGRAAFKTSVDPYFEIPAAATGLGINNAIIAANASNGKIVLLEARTYTIETPILPLTGTTIWGMGTGRTRLVLDDGIDNDVIQIASGVEDVILQDFHINGNPTQQTTAGRGIAVLGSNSVIDICRIVVSNAWGEGISFPLEDPGSAKAYYDVSLRDIRISFPGSHGINIVDTDGLNDQITLSGIHIDHPGASSGEELLSADGLRVQGYAQISDVSVRMNQATAHTGAGIHLRTPDASGSPSQGFKGTLTNFHIRGDTDEAIGLWVRGHKAAISNGVVRMEGSTAKPLVVDGRGTEGSNEAALENTITGCYFDDGLQNDVTVDAIGTRLIGCRFANQSADGIVIKGDDTIVSACDFETIGANGITIQNTALDVRISDSRFKAITEDGIELEAGALNTVIQGNSFIDINDAGVLLLTGANDSIVDGNVFENVLGIGVEVRAGALRTFVDSNVFSDVAGLDIFDDGTDTTVGFGNLPREPDHFIPGDQHTNFGQGDFLPPEWLATPLPYGGNGVRKYRLKLEFVLQGSFLMNFRIFVGPAGDATDPVLFSANSIANQQHEIDWLEFVPVAGADFISVYFNEQAGNPNSDLMEDERFGGVLSPVTPDRSLLQIEWMEI